MLDPRRLQALSAVVDAGSITAAASVLGYTPSAISQSIATLEREASIALLEKAGRGVRPTQAGLLLADHARIVLARLTDAEEALAALRAGQAGRLRLATFATAGASLVPPALARFRDTHPGVEIDLAIVEIDEAVARLRDARIDIAVVALEGLPADFGASVAVHRLLDDPYLLVLPRNHRLAHRRSVDLADVADDPWIITSYASCDSRTPVIQACARAGFSPRFAIEADEFATTLGFCAAGVGVALVPWLALTSLPDGVRARKLREHAPVRNVLALTRKSSDDAAVRAVVALMRQTARDYAPA